MKVVGKFIGKVSGNSQCSEGPARYVSHSPRRGEVGNGVASLEKSHREISSGNFPSGNSSGNDWEISFGVRDVASGMVDGWYSDQAMAEDVRDYLAAQLPGREVVLFAADRSQRFLITDDIWLSKHINQLRFKSDPRFAAWEAMK